MNQKERKKKKALLCPMKKKNPLDLLKKMEILMLKSSSRTIIKNYCKNKNKSKNSKISRY
jgi:hypothetical protein